MEADERRLVHVEQREASASAMGLDIGVRIMLLGEGKPVTLGRISHSVCPEDPRRMQAQTGVLCCSWPRTTTANTSYHEAEDCRAVKH